MGEDLGREVKPRWSRGREGGRGYPLAVFVDVDPVSEEHEGNLSRWELLLLADLLDEDANAIERFLPGDAVDQEEALAHAIVLVSGEDKEKEEE